MFYELNWKKMINARDLGGLETVDGKKIKKGKLIRCGRLSDLPENTVKKLDGLGEKTVIDLRTTAGLNDHPDTELKNSKRVWLPTITTVSDRMNDEKTMRLTMKRESERLKKEFDTVDDYMIETYRSIMFKEEPQESLKKFLNEVIEDDGCVIWHCNSGKDRTGICAMLVETLLGVKEEDIYRDYMHSNWCLRKKNRMLKFLLYIAPMGYKFKKFLLGFLKVKKEYLKSVIDEANERFGSVTEYCKQALGINEEQIAKLKKKYLTV